MFGGILDDVVVKVLGSEGFDLVVELRRSCLTGLLLLAQEDGGVPVDPVLQRLVAVVALVDDRLEFAGKDIKTLIMCVSKFKKVYNPNKILKISGWFVEHLIALRRVTKFIKAS